jgi:dGTPase
MMYGKNDANRYYNEEKIDEEEYRTPYRRDFARVLHSHGMRRLAGKTQLFPSSDSDFFRNRLTHSLEVAQIAKTIAIKINETVLKNKPELKIDLDLVELAGLAHDLGHPPFGHQGEEILAEKMYLHGGFEGNAQTLRLISKIEKKVQNGLLTKSGFDNSGHDKRFGLNLTYRSLASILKYDSVISSQIDLDDDGNKSVYKGYYATEKALVTEIKKNVTNGKDYESVFKTIECCIMDIADDITYSTYDLEDAFKAGFISPLDMLIQNRDFYTSISKEVSKIMGYEVSYDDIINVLSDLIKFMFKLPSDYIDDMHKLRQEDMTKEEYMFLGQQYANKYNQIIIKNGYARTDFSSQLIKASIDKIKFVPVEDIPALSYVELENTTKKRIEILKRIAFTTQVLSPKLKTLEYRGKMIVEEIFDALTPKNSKGKLVKVPELLPDDYKNIYIQRTDENHKYRTVCDFIACMTDRYALQFYGRIKSISPVSIFTPFS